MGKVKEFFDLLDQTRAGQKVVGTEGWRMLGSLASKYDAEREKVLVDPMLPERGRNHRLRELRETEGPAATASWREKYLGLLEQKVAKAEPRPRHPAVPDSFTADVLRQTDGIDAQVLSLLYESTEDDRVAAALAQAPPRIKLLPEGQGFKIEPRVDAEAVKRRAYRLASDEDRGHYDVLREIHQSLIGAAGQLERAMSEE